MSLLPDIASYIEREFSAEDQAMATSLVLFAVLHDGRSADPRCQRAALVGSDGSLKRLEYYVGLLKIDFRDVIVAGEFEARGLDLRRVRDLNVPFTTGSG